MSIQAPLGDVHKVVNDGRVDGKCSLTGFMGNLMMDLLLRHWLHLGHKLINDVSNCAH